MSRQATGQTGRNRLDRSLTKMSLDTAVAVNTDTEGFLANRDDWSEEVALELARRDGVELTETMLRYIVAAREMYENDGVVPPIRRFAKEMGVTTNDLYAVFMKGPMKLICKWGGLPKPTGCV
jgi:dissimilatory sulfite reductase related protein